MGTTAKALSLLSLFSRSRSHIGLSEMARLSGMNKATVHRLMGELLSEGFVEQAGSGRDYRLGPVFLRLAALREAAVPMRDMVQSALHELAEKTGETAHVSLLQGQVLSTLSYAYANQHGTRVTMEDADILPLHATSSGLAVLAFSPTSLLEEVVSTQLAAHTKQTLTTPAALKAEVENTRKQGMAEYVAGFETDVHTFALPLFDAQQACIGAIAVASPMSRMTDALKALVTRELAEAAPRLTRQMGGFLPADFIERLG